MAARALCDYDSGYELVAVYSDGFTTRLEAERIEQYCAGRIADADLDMTLAVPHRDKIPAMRHETSMD